MLASIFGKKKPSYVKKGRFFSFTKGYDINLTGDVENGDVLPNPAKTFSVSPKDYILMSPIPKVTVQVGDNVKAGDILFFDKKRPNIQYTAPVSGEVVDVTRGAKRAIDHVVILADKEMSYKKFDVPALTDEAAVTKLLLESGCWTSFVQRPFDIVPDVDARPRDIFVTTFNTAPLALDYNRLVEGKEAFFQKGLDVLNVLSQGKVYLGLDGNGSEPSRVFSEAKGVEINYFAGKHPSGNVGVQIHHVAPIKGEDKVWTVDVSSVLKIGRLFAEGIYDASTLVKVAGSAVKRPAVYSTFEGASIQDLLSENLTEDNVRIISGDVLSGKAVPAQGYVTDKAQCVTVIKEGDKHRFLGWMLPVSPAPSISPTFISSLIPGMSFSGDTNTYGERRSFVLSGQYESMLPMDIYVQHLMKAILTNDFEQMEGLGINELSEEDVAICEFACTSKQPLQKILRQGLDTIREQS